MAATTPETVFVFYSFEAILCTLLLFALLWAFRRNRQLRYSHNLLVLPALAAMGMGFATASGLSFYQFYYQERLIPGPAEGLASPAFAWAALFFLLFSTAKSRIVGRLGWLLFAALMLMAAALALYAGSWRSWVWLVPSVCFALAFAASLRTPGPTETPGLMALSLGLFLAGCLIPWIVELLGPDSVSWWVSVARHVAFLLALGVMSQVVEADSGELFIKFFIRLNLTFIVLAGFIILFVARQQRQEYLEFAVQEASRLTEYLRGHMLHFHGRGMTPEEILSNPEVNKRIVADFGNFPNLKEVFVFLQDRRLSLAIDSQGLIEREIRIVRPLQSFSDQPILEGERLRLPSAVLSGDELLGGIELRKSVAAMNRAIAQHMVWIFSFFTLAVICSGVLIGIIVTNADSTIQLQYQRLRETDLRMARLAKVAALGEMAGGVAHEINNPLGIILGRADLLLKLARRGETDERVEDLEVIRRQAARAGRITSDLLDFSRPHPLDLRPKSVDEVARKTTRLLEPLVKSRGIALETQFLANALVAVDSDRIEQVLVNLIQNAIDACDKGPDRTIRIVTRARRSKGVVEILVEDSGCGISSDVQERIFDPFFTTKAQGTGLGLSVSFGIVRQHGGTIELESGGSRTRFVVVLPIAEPASDEESVENKSSSEPVNTLESG